MQQQKENLTAQVNETRAAQLALDEETAALKLALGDITSSLHDMAASDADPTPPTTEHSQLNQTQPSPSSAEVSVDGTCGPAMRSEALLCYITEPWVAHSAQLELLW